MLINMDESVSIGGWRGWLEDGGGEHAEELLNAMHFAPKSEPIKTIKVLLKIFEALMSQGLTASSARQSQVCCCDSCGGREVLDDDHSECPTCNGEGVVWSGMFIRRDAWLQALSETYLKINEKQRKDDIVRWSKTLADMDKK